MNSKERIQEFIYALKEEIIAIKGRGGNIFKVFYGKYLRETAGYHVYKFNLENPLVIMDDTPADFIYKNRKYNCYVISSQGTALTLGIEEFLGETIYEGILETNLWFLLEMLQKKYEESLDSSSTDFKLSEDLFNGISIYLNRSNAPNYLPNPDKIPNNSQKRAIEKSYNNSLTFIWGPPGTGKTTTIALIVQSLLNENKKILLVSHANAAVDSALEDVAKQLEGTSFYSEGKLVRLGLHVRKSLEKYELVFLDNIEEKLGKTLVQERNKLNNDLKLHIESLNNFENILIDLQKYENLDQEIIEIDNSLAIISNEKKDNESQVEVCKNNLLKKKSDLQKALNTGKFKRMLTGHKPENIQRDIDNIGLRIDSLNRNIVGLNKKIAQGKSAFLTKKKEYSLLKESISSILKKYKLTIPDLKDQENKLKNNIDEIKIRISEIEKSLKEIRSKILNDVQLIATTLTKTFSSKEFPNIKFDNIIVDESSMAPMPYIYWAVSKVKEQSQIVGDFLQLPPISTSNDKYAERWLKRSIYEHLEIDIDSVHDNRRNIVLLEEQFRMHPNISQIPNDLFYQKKLKNGNNVSRNVYSDFLSGSKPLILVDTSDKNPWCSQISSGGRFNLYNAFVTAKTAKALYDENNEVEIGILSPYKAQTRLINKILKDWGINENFETATTHSFQGGEKDIILIDCVEGPGAKNWSLLQHSEDSDKLLNVTITRAKKKIYLILHREHIESYFPPTSVFLRILKYFDSRGMKINSRDLIREDDFFTKADEFIKDSEIVYDSALEKSTKFTEMSFWQAFISDLEGCKENLIIVSPFTSLNRIGKLMIHFSNLVSKNVNVLVFVRPPQYQGGSLIEQAEQSISLLGDWGIKVIQRNKIHQKIAIIDNKITWEGSLNILSHNKTEEHMRRIVGVNTAKELISDLDLDSDNAVDNLLSKLCPECLQKGINSPLTVKISKYGKFLACSSFPKCRYTEKFRNR